MCSYENALANVLDTSNIMFSGSCVYNYACVHVSHHTVVLVYIGIAMGGPALVSISICLIIIIRTSR